MNNMKNRKLSSKIIAKNRLLIAARKAEAKQSLTSRENRSLTRLLIALGGPLLICTMTSCGFIAGGTTDGYTISCNGAGCSKFTEYATALITETKHDGKDTSAYWKHREGEVNRVTWMESLFGKRGQ